MKIVVGKVSGMYTLDLAISISGRGISYADVVVDAMSVFSAVKTGTSNIVSWGEGSATAVTVIDCAAASSSQGLPQHFSLLVWVPLMQK